MIALCLPSPVGQFGVYPRINLATLSSILSRANTLFDTLLPFRFLSSFQKFKDDDIVLNSLLYVSFQYKAR